MEKRSAIRDYTLDDGHATNVRITLKITGLPPVIDNEETAGRQLRCIFWLWGDSMKFYVEIVKSSSGEVVKRMGPMSEKKADKVEFGASINLNHEEYFTRIVSA